MGTVEGAAIVAGTVPRATPENGKVPRRHRLDTYVEDDLYEWVHRQAAAQERSASSWLRFVLMRLRDGLQEGVDPAMLTGGGASDQP